MSGGLPRRPGFVAQVRRTASANVAMSVVSALGGLLAARWLGPTDRGYYAGITTWSFFLVVAGELGLSAALVYWVSQDRARADDYVRTGTALLMAVAVPLAGIAFLIAGGLAHAHSEALLAYRVGLLSSLVYFAGAAPTHVLQTLSLQRWGVVRLIQPLCFVVCMVLVHLTIGLTLLWAAALQVAAFLLQVIVAWGLYLPVRPAVGRADPGLLRPLVAFGLPSVLASGSTLLNARADQLVMSVLVPPEELARYAIAVSLTTLAAPVTSALGNVLFPRLAAEATVTDAAREKIRKTLLASYGIGTLATLPLVLAGHWFVVPVFGAGYSGVARLATVLGPGAVLVAANALLGDMLRGLGRPVSAARSQLFGLVMTAGGLAVLVPRFGAMGAAVTSVVVYAVVHARLLVELRRRLRVVESMPGHESPSAQESGRSVNGSLV